MEEWYRNTFLWGQTNLTEDDPAGCDLEFWKQYWKKTGVQGIIINCGGIVSYYHSGKKGQYHAKFLQEKTDYFDVWNQAAREAGLRVIARMDMQTTTEELYRSNPEWYCVDREGNPILSQGRYMTCVNGGYYHQYIPDVFREVISRFHPDGFADNSWAGTNWDTICYCESCREKFKKRYGLDLPKAADWQDPAYRRWIRFGYEVRVENWRFLNQVTKEASGGSCRWFGMLCADPFHTGGRFYDIHKLAKETPFIFCDQQSRDIRSPFEQNAWNGSLLKMAAGEDVVIAESMAHYYKGLRTFRLSSGEKQETLKWMVSGFSGGISPWYHFVGGGLRDKRKIQISADLYRWYKENLPYLRHRKNVAAIGLLWNQETIIYYGRDQSDSVCRMPFMGFAMALSRVGIPFVPVHTDDLERYEDRLLGIVLPNVAILTEEQQGQIVRFLERGKGMVMTGVTGRRDSEGERMEDSGKLWEYLGMELEEETFGASSGGEENWMYHNAHNYLLLPEERHPVFDGFGDTDLIAFGGTVQKVKCAGSLEQVAAYIPEFPIYPPEHAWVREERPDIGTVFAGRLSSGGRVVYLAADLDRTYGQYRIPDQGRILEQAVKYAAGRPVPVEVKALGHIHCETYYQEGRLVIHLVNLLGCESPAGTVHENLPAHEVTVILSGMEPEGDTACGRVSGKTWEICRTGGNWSIKIEVLGEHELLVCPVKALL